MKLSRMELRRLIESVINEDPVPPTFVEENPGSAFGRDEMGRIDKQRSDKRIRDAIERARVEANKTLDWFMDIKDRMDAGENGPFVADQDYCIALGAGDGPGYYFEKDTYDDVNRGEMIPKGAEFGGPARYSDFDDYGDGEIDVSMGLLKRSSSPQTKSDTNFKSISDFYERFEQEVLYLEKSAENRGIKVSIPMESFNQ